MPELSDFIDEDTLRRLIETARLEDLGPDGVDTTSNCFIDIAAEGSAAFVTRQPGIVSGLAMLPAVCSVYGAGIAIDAHFRDADHAEPGDQLATITGPMRTLLAIERVALNLLTHLSGIATLTGHYVDRCVGTHARIYDTRKTLPGLRGLQKYAVACGGGATHRIGLFDAVLIKDNHLSGVPIDQLAQRLSEACDHARQTWPALKFVEIEVDTLDQLVEVLKAPIDIVLLDNMSPPKLKEAVAMRDELAPKIALEASGGVNLDTVAAIAKTGVDRISVGALTHSAPSLDIGLDIG